MSTPPTDYSAHRPAVSPRNEPQNRAAALQGHSESLPVHLCTSGEILNMYTRCPALEGMNPAERLIVPWCMETCCACNGEAVGPFPGALPPNNALPPQLAAIGVDERSWQQWLDFYVERVVPHSDQTCLVLAVLAAWLLVIPGVVLTFCVPTHKCTKLHGEVGAWLEFMNRDLRPKNAFVKLQRVTGNLQAHTTREEDRNFLVFALTPQEARRLAAEPVVLSQSCGCCTGMPSDHGALF